MFWVKYYLEVGYMFTKKIQLLCDSTPCAFFMAFSNRENPLARLCAFIVCLPLPPGHTVYIPWPPSVAMRLSPDHCNVDKRDGKNGSPFPACLENKTNVILNAFSHLTTDCRGGQGLRRCWNCVIKMSGALTDQVGHGHLVDQHWT